MNKGTIKLPERRGADGFSAPKPAAGSVHAKTTVVMPTYWFLVYFESVVYLSD